MALASIGALLPALGIELLTPLLGVVAYLLLSNFVSTLLPEGLGASSLVSGLAVLTLLGAEEAQAVAFGATAWGVRVGPLVLLGAWPLAQRVGDLTVSIAQARSVAGEGP